MVQLYNIQASIRSKTPAGQTEHVCGAVIITKYHILTAAHCVRDLDKDVYYVRIGDYNMEVLVQVQFIILKTNKQSRPEILWLPGLMSKRRT